MMTDNRMRPGGVTIRQRCGGVLVLLALVALAWSAITVLTGGFVLRLGGVTLASRSPLRPFAAALILAAVARGLLGAVSFAAWIAWVAGDRSRRVGRMAVMFAAAT